LGTVRAQFEPSEPSDKRLTKPIDPMSDLAKALEGAAKSIDDEPNDDEPLLIEEGLDREG